MLDAMKGALRPVGFRKHGTHFVRLVGDVWQVVNLQSSKWNISSEPLEVFINIGLCFGSESRQISNPKTGPKEYECHWRGRLKRDKKETWSVGSEAEARRIGELTARGGLVVVERAIELCPTPAALLAHPDGITSVIKVEPGLECQMWRALGWLENEFGHEGPV